MAALPSNGGETSAPQQSSLVPAENLVSADTQLITPILAEAFELPYLPMSNSAMGKEHQSKDLQAREFTAGDFQTAAPIAPTQAPSQSMMPQNINMGVKQPSDFNYQRGMYGGAQQPLMGNFFPQQSPGNLSQQAAYPIEPPDHQMQGLYRQQPSIPGQQIPPGYAGMSPQYNGWMDPAMPGSYNAAPTSGKHPPEANVGSDPDNDDYQARALKRPRLVWTLQLHQRFVDAVEQLGLKNAVPKTIMQLMNVDGLTRENVASHLQKYRLQLKKDDGKGGDELDKMVDEETHKELEPEQPRLTISEGFK